jgi:hypothetical protein
MAYGSHYRVAALDFLILIFVGSITNRYIKYNLPPIQEKLFCDIKKAACSVKIKKMYDILQNYSLDIEPLANFTI